MPGQHSDGDARVTELDERATLAVDAFTGQEEVFSAHVSVDQVFILLQSRKGELNKAAPGCLSSVLPTLPPFLTLAPWVNLSVVPSYSQTGAAQVSHPTCDLSTLQNGPHQ